MADNKTIQRHNVKITTQSNYAKAIDGNGSKIAYKFIPRDDPKYITSKSLESIGVYYGEKNLDLPKEFNNKWIMTGYNVGKRKVRDDSAEKILEDIDENNLMIMRIKRVKQYLLNHNNTFSQDENDLISVGIYYKKNNLELPIEFSSPLVWLGYYGIPLDEVYINQEEKHITK